MKTNTKFQPIKRALQLLLLLQATPCLADDHGDTIQSASTISQANTTGHLGEADIDWLRLNITEPGRVWIYSTGTIDTRCTITDSVGNFIDGGGNDDDDGKNFNFLTERVFQPGSYFLKIENGGSGVLTGDYTLSVRAPQFSEPFSGPNRHSSLGILGDHDLYRLTVPVSGKHWVYSTGNTDTHATLYEANGSFLAGGANDDDDGAQNNFLTSTILQPGEYFLLVKDGGSGSLVGDYTLSWRGPHNAQPFEERDRTASLGVLGDLDLYRIRPNPNGPLWIYTSGNTDTRGTLYNDAGGFVLGGANDDDDGANRNFSSNGLLASGDYYLLVEDGSSGNLTGDYTLHLRDASRATALQGSGSRSESLDLSGELDLFVFSHQGGNISFSTSGQTATYGTIYEKDGSFATGGANDQNDGVGDNFLIEDSLIEGTYYLLVRGDRIDTTLGSYELNSSFNPGDLTTLSQGGAVINSGGTSSLEITSNTAWSVSGLASWVQVSQTSGSGNATLSLTYTPNLTGARREAVITVAGQSYTVTQLAEGDNTGQPVPAQTSIALGILITVPTEAGSSYRVETSDDMSTWIDTGVVLEGNGAPQNLAFERGEARQFYRAVPQ